MSSVKSKVSLIAKLVVIGLGFSSLSHAYAENQTVEADKDKVKAQAAASEVEESALKFVPLLTSTPLMGAGIGGAVSYLYDTDEGSSKSQLRLSGQYSETDSYDISINNNAWLDGNNINSQSFFALANINHGFTEDGVDVGYNTNKILAKQTFIMNSFGDFYFGVPLTYIDIEYNATNDAGEQFIKDNGITDVRMGGVGLNMTYDTRKNKYFPQGSSLVSISAVANPEMLGAEDDFSLLTVDARHYAKGFKSQDVLAMQFFGQYASEKTPDVSLPTLSGKDLLRGFPGGQFKARYMSGAQAEYRYVVEGTKFKLTTFAGVANLSGGSYGTDGNSRDDDGWYSAAGVGIRYAIQEKTGIDLRLDLVRTSEDENSLYLKLNQAF
ncbi:BamA/TamA family outer membrane protein [Thalassotalea sp. PLHSN55]|uniref:BamA/TamA family outer membrane protein n=1 Tax=Thalassotalea sp. PLHSN55 TaxID=3435888 RepID=UPI003F8269A4